MTILVLGAGSIGSVFGGFLALAGHRVILVGRQPHMDAIARFGLLIDGIWGRHIVTERIIALSDVHDASTASVDLCLLTVKSYDTASAVRMLCDTFSDPPIVLSLQNGLGNVETIESLVGKHKTIGGRVIFGVEYREPGHVTVTVAADVTRIGSRCGTIPRHKIEQIASLLTQAGIPTEATDTIERYLWGKVLYNCALNPLATLLNVPYGKLLSSDAAREIMRAIIFEIFAVAKKLNVTLDWAEPEQYVELLFNELIPKTFEHHPSMLQDVLRGKPTEIDSLNGAIADLAVKVGCDAPYNTLLRSLIKAKETSCVRTATSTH
ncbi:MAG: ketopantoate reductase family protein [Desulfobacterota bacterium]|nr:ketopantoate reductase family protein [Thermodesulfobacteriota bacterium]